jgi:uncharacterized lipoprotein YbaY/LysM repeat protein
MYKFIYLLLVVTLLLSAVPGIAQAQEPPPPPGQPLEPLPEPPVVEPVPLPTQPVEPVPPLPEPPTVEPVPLPTQPVEPVPPLPEPPTVEPVPLPTEPVEPVPPLPEPPVEPSWPVDAAQITIDIPVAGEIVSPVEVIVVGTGTALPENNVVVQAITAGGEILAEVPATVAGPLGGTGQWRVVLAPGAEPGTRGRIYAFATSPADGTILADASVNVTFGQEGPPTPPPSRPEIAIDTPAPGEVVSPDEIVVVGTGVGLPENNVVVRALAADGRVLAEQSATVDAEVGGTGEWRVTLYPGATPGTSGRIYAFAPSPADGRILAEASVNVRYGSGPVVRPEITIDSPEPGQVVDPRGIVVIGTGTALPENNVVVQALDRNGRVLDEQTATVDADLGGSGAWRVTLQPDVAPGTPGRIYAFAPSPADGRILADASVNVQYGSSPVVRPEIAIDIPTPGEVVSPYEVVVVGTGAGLPENNVVVRALAADGRVLDEQATIVDADLGGAGEWRVTLYPRVAPGTSGRIYAFAPSPADGSILAEASVNVRYGSGPVVQPEIAIDIPLPGEVVSPREVVVVGKGTALPENNVVVQALDRNGRVLDQQAVIVDAELGGSGEWRAILRPNAAPGTPGQIYAYADSPADGRILADAAVFVTYGQAQQQPMVDITSPSTGAVVNTDSGIQVRGKAANIFENNVVVQILDRHGRVLASAPTTASQSGDWSIVLLVGVVEGPGSIVAFAPSPTGGTLASDRVNVTFSSQPPPPRPFIDIQQPGNGARVDADRSFTVSGVGQGLFEGNVVVRVRDAYGRTLRQAVTTARSDGRWAVSFNLLIADGTPGNIYAFSTSPANGAVVADDSVTVTFVSSCRVRTDWPVYVVQRGDSLFTIAQEFGTTVAELTYANCLTNPNVVYVGQTLYVPPAPPKPVVPLALAVAIMDPRAGGEVIPDVPLVVSGVATGTVPGNVFVRALDNLGRVLGEAQGQAATGAVAGDSWAWSAELTPTDVQPGTRGTLYAYALGGGGAVIAATAVDVVYGQDDGKSPFVAITGPLPYAQLDDNQQIVVQGSGRGLFENNVVVQLLDNAGNVLLTQPTTMRTAEIGGAGTWELTVATDYVGRGQIRAFHTDAADGHIVTEASVDVIFGDPTAAPSSVLINFPLPNTVWTARTPVAAIAGSAQGVDPEALQLVVTDQTGTIVALLPVALDARTGLWSTTIDAEAVFWQDAALTVQIVAAAPTGGRPLTDRIPLFIQRNDSLLTGAVTYLQRIALPPDAVVKVRIVNSSLADAPPEMVFLAEQVIRNAVGSPIPFAVPFSSADVDERALYSVGARIEDADGKLLFISTTVNPVITRGNPTSDVEVRVTQTP